VCDSTNNHYPNGITCRLRAQSNCNVLSLTGTCATCNTNFYLDVNSSCCVAVAMASLTVNCAVYNSGQVCIICTGNRPVLNAQYAFVHRTIANFQVYRIAQGCVQCAAGKVVKRANFACVAKSTNVNCVYQTFLGRRARNSGFVFNANLPHTNHKTGSYMAFQYLVMPPTSSSMVGPSLPSARP